MAEKMNNFIKKHLALLKLEKDAEIDRNSNEKNQIAHLVVASDRPGPYGITILTFEKAPPLNSDFPSHAINKGDEIFASCESSECDCSIHGSVTTISKTSLSIAIDDIRHTTDWHVDNSYNVIKLCDGISNLRLENCLINLRSTGQQHLKDVCFGKCSPDEPLTNLRYPTGESMAFINDELNGVQKEAVLFALKQRDLSIIHGPPGTGKTTTLVEIISQAVKMKQKILVCAPSNVAVDNLVEKLANNEISVVRLGKPDRAMEYTKKYTLDAAILNSSFGFEIKSYKRAILSTLSQLRKAKKSIQNVAIMRDLAILKKNLIFKETEAMKEVLPLADVILSTLTSAHPEGSLQHVMGDHFGMVVIDECSQAIEAACWIALTRAPKCVLAGDHMQLPPTVISKRAAKEGLSISLMERLIEQFGTEAQKVVRMLNVQFRMNANIMTWSSEQFYYGRLSAHPTVESHLLPDLIGVQRNKYTEQCLLMIDTAGCHYYENANSKSKSNKAEADLVKSHVEKLISSGLKMPDIGIISPYNAQVECIRSCIGKLYPRLEIKSVDSFQGREKEAIIISLVRSNPKGLVGFLSERRRLNVAVTRAKRHLAIIGDSQTVSRNPVLRSFVTHVHKCGRLIKASIYSDASKFKDQVNQERMKQPSQNMKERKVVIQNEPSIQHKFQNLSINDGNDRIERITQSSQNITERKTVIRNEPTIQHEPQNLNINNGYNQRLVDALHKFYYDPGQIEKSFRASDTSDERRIIAAYCNARGMTCTSDIRSFGQITVIRKVKVKQRSPSKCQIL